MIDLHKYAMMGLFGGFGSGSGGSGGSSSDEEWFNDGDTHIWITLGEGRTSPMLGVCPKGTVTVDWGDGTEPDTLTGTRTSTVKWTPTHNYAKPGDYIITLKVDGEMGIAGASGANTKSYLLRFSSAGDGRNNVYQNTITRIELGNGVTSIEGYAFCGCHSLASVVIPDSVTSIGNSAFSDCYSLASVVIPGSVTSIGDNAFQYCYSLASVVIPDSVTSIGGHVFSYCFPLTSVVIPGSVTSIGDNAFHNCRSLVSVVIPGSVTSIGKSVFYYCYSLTSVVIPDSVTSIRDSVFQYCYSLASVVIPDSVTSIGDCVFYNCSGVAYYDFTNHTQVPTLSTTNTFSGIAADCEIRVPAALYDEWIAATNWSAKASKIVAV